MENNSIGMKGYSFVLDIERDSIEKYIQFRLDDSSHVLDNFKSVKILYLCGFDRDSGDQLQDFDLINNINKIVNNSFELAKRIFIDGLIITRLNYQILWEGILSHVSESNKEDYYLCDELKRVDELIQLLKIKEQPEYLNFSITHTENKNYKPKKIINYPLNINMSLFDKIAEDLYKDWAKRYRLDALNEGYEVWWPDLYYNSKTFNCGAYLSLKRGWKCSFTLESLTVIRDTIKSWKTNYKTSNFNQYLKSSARILHEFITDVTQELSIMEKDKHKLIFSFLLITGGLYEHKHFDHTMDFNDQKEDFIKHLLRKK